MLRRLLMVATVTGNWLGCAHPSSPSAAVGATPEPRRGVNGDDVHGIPARQVEDVVEGRVPGVLVIRSPGGGGSLRIWGPTTIHGNNEPLYVLDRMPLNVPPGRGFFCLGPNDIERIEVRQDATALRKYGA